MSETTTAKRAAAKKTAAAPAPKAEPTGGDVAPETPPVAEAPPEAPAEPADAQPDAQPDPAADPAVADLVASGWSVNQVVGKFVAQIAAPDGEVLSAIADSLADLPAAAKAELERAILAPSPVYGEEPPAAPAPLTPASAVIDAPPVPDPPADPLAIVPTVNEAAGERIRVTEATVVVRDVRGNKVDPDEVFSPPQPGTKVVTCRIRLIQHTTATAYRRHVETLLLPAGALVSTEAASDIIAAIKAEDAAAS